MKRLWKRLKSKTYWLGLSTLALGGLETAQATGSVPNLFDGKMRALATVLTAVLIFVLREATRKPVADK